MNDVLSELLAWNATVPAAGTLVKGSFLLGLGFLAAPFLRRASASGRHLLWTVVLTAVVCLPVLEAALPGHELRWLPASRTAADAPSRALTRPPEPIAGPGLDAGEPPRMAGEPRRAAGEASARRWSWRSAVFGLWALGALLWLASLAVSLLSLARTTRQARELATDGSWGRSLESVRRRFGLRRSVRLLVHPRVTAPLTWGAFRPVVLLPSAARKAASGERFDVLAHELAHVERHDWVLRLLARIACALYWFHPMVWLAAARLSFESERACDDRVLMLGSGATSYAERLLGMARRASPGPAAAVAMVRRGELSRRVAAILDPTLRRTNVKPAQILTASLVSFGLLAVLASARLVRAAEPPPAADAALKIGDLSAPLLHAALVGDLAEVRRRLDAGDDIDSTVRGVPGTPLILAATAGHTDVVRLLLERGADPNLAERSRPRLDGLARTALNGAARSGHTEIVRLLLDAGARVDAAPAGDATPLIAAARGGHVETAKLLLEHAADADVAIPGDGTPLISAAGSGVPGTVGLLLEAGADPDRAVAGDGSPLIVAARAGDVETVRLLLEAGADPNRGVAGDGSPLIVAAREGHKEIVELLLDHGADVDRVVAGDENALIQAAAHGRLETVRLLLDRGADVNMAVHTDGSPLSRFERRSALTMARRGGYKDVVELLKSYGAVE